MKFRTLTLTLGLALLSASPSFAAKKGKNPLVLITTTLGDIKVELYQDKAPISTANFLSYVKDKHYDGTVFHRVIKGFMIQGGNMDSNLSPHTGIKPSIKNEASNGEKNVEGTIAMARTPDPDSASDQFFINVKDNGFLDKNEGNPGYAVFGKVVSGMDIAHKIEQVPTGTKNGMGDVPNDPVVIKSVKVVKK